MQVGKHVNGSILSHTNVSLYRTLGFMTEIRDVRFQLFPKRTPTYKLGFWGEIGDGDKGQHL